MMREEHHGASRDESAMAEHIHTHSARVRAGDGSRWEARVMGARRGDGTWAGWLEFRSLDEPGRIARTGQETSQPDRRALVYWAGGLEPVYLDGALKRAGC